MPKFIVDIYAEGEDDQWYMDFMEDQLNISAGSVIIKPIDVEIKENKAAIELLRRCITLESYKLQGTTIKYMLDAINTLERNNGGI